MKAVLVSMVGALILTVGFACGSSDEEGPTSVGQTADLSQFPTPTRSLIEPGPTAPPPDVQSPSGQNQGDSAEVAALTQEEIQRLRQRLQSGELSEEEAQQAVQRLRAQFGAGPGGPQFGGEVGGVAVGSIESIEEDSITINVELASITANIGENTNIRITSVLEPTDLTEGGQVMVVSERVEGSALARVVTVVSEGQRRASGGGLGGQRGFGDGQGGLGGEQGDVGDRPLYGTLENVSNSGFLLETQQGPLAVTLNDQSVVVQTRQGTLDDLETGMVVSVAGPSDEDGRIDARLVSVTPEGLEDVRGFGVGNNAGARGLGGGN